jgi:uncharacterized sporulation protein YeaH/YhbH (DUF444 family)
MFSYFPIVLQGDIVLELGLYAEIDEAREAAESLMRRALNESSRRQKADEELVSALQKVQSNTYSEVLLNKIEPARSRCISISFRTILIRTLNLPGKGVPGAVLRGGEKA